MRKQELMKQCSINERAGEIAARAAAVNKDIGEWLDVAAFYSASGEAYRLLRVVHEALTAELAAAAAATGWVKDDHARL